MGVLYFTTEAAADNERVPADQDSRTSFPDKGSSSAAASAALHRERLPPRSTVRGYFSCGDCDVMLAKIKTCCAQLLPAAAVATVLC
jgi:hypothetical protein